MEAAVQAGGAVAAENLIEQLVIAGVHPQVTAAINLAAPPIRSGAIGTPWLPDSGLV